MKKLIILLALVALVAVGCQSTRGTTAGETADDAYIVSAINGKILADADLKFLQIDVSSYNGNVSLNGRVPGTAAESKLINLARSTKGVKNVSSNLMVAGATGAPEPSSRSAPGMGSSSEAPAAGMTPAPAPAAK